MIKYTCTIPASKDIRGEYDIHTVEHISHYPITDSDLRKIVIDKLPREYVCFAHITYTFEGV